MNTMTNINLLQDDETFLSSFEIATLLGRAHSEIRYEFESLCEVAKECGLDWADVWTGQEGRPVLLYLLDREMIEELMQRYSEQERASVLRRLKHKEEIEVLKGQIAPLQARLEIIRNSVKK